MMLKPCFYELPNGMRGIHLPAAGPVTHLAVMVKAGARNETELHSGIAHFIEHTLFKGTRKRNNLAIINCLDRVGGELNAYTTKEITCLHASFGSRYLDLAADLLSDICCNATFPAKEIEKEKEVIAEEIRMYLDTPGEQIFDDFENLLFGKHPLGNSILGSEESIRRLKTRDLLSFISTHYRGPNMILCSSGDFTCEQMKAVATRWFGRLPAAPVDIAPQPRPRKFRKGYEHLRRDTFQGHCITGGPGMAMNQPGRAALSLMLNVLGGPAMNSRLNISIREKHGLAYAAEAGGTGFTDSGFFSVYVGTEAQHIEKCLALIHKEFKLLREKTFGTATLAGAKRQYLGQLMLMQENRLSVMLSYGKGLLLGGKVVTFEELATRVEKVTAAEIQETANKLLHPDNHFTLEMSNR